MGRILRVTVREKNSSRYEYKNRINLDDSSQILLVLKDLEVIFGAPIRKTCIKFLEKKVFPI